MKNILDRLNQGETIVADGAMGTMLQQYGVNINKCVEAVNLSNPELLGKIATGYLNAGAEIIQTNTFGASTLKLSNYSLDNQTAEINSSAVKAVQNAVGDNAYISGSCGPSGKILLPYGDTAPDKMYSSYLAQIHALITAGVDIICVETMLDINEAKLAIKSAREISSTIPIIATMTFEKTPKGFFTIMGVSIEEACLELEKAGADIIGSNCGNGLELMIQIAREFKANTNLPIIIQSNAGMPEIINGDPTYGETPDFFSQRIGQLIDIGVSIIGGCCGTTPAHIKAIRNIVDSVAK